VQEGDTDGRKMYQTEQKQGRKLYRINKHTNDKINKNK
jgi:hypothetical protein